MVRCGTTTKETQELLAVHAKTFINVTKSNTAIEKTSIENLRLEIDMERKAQHRGMKVDYGNTGVGYAAGYGSAKAHEEMEEATGGEVRTQLPTLIG